VGRILQEEDEEKYQMSEKTWTEGVRTGEFRNLSTMKKKKRGKRPPRPRGLKVGIHAKRMEKRRP